MPRFSAPDYRPVLGPVKARPCGRPAAGLDRACAPAVIWRRRRIGAQQDQLNQSVHGSRGTPGACWLNLQEGWWRIFRRQALAGQAFADPDEIAHATQVATAQLNARARPWIWGRPQPKPRTYRRRFIYTL
jgi:hypothetical protein